MSLSIITPTFNAGSLLRETLESVRSQFGSGMEHLLIDAASTDETLRIAGEFPHLSIISESDRGIYDGMNKGASRANGDWLLFLQGDDWLPEGTLSAYLSAIASNPDAGIICGDCEALRRAEETGEDWLRVWHVDDPNDKKLSVRNIALGEPMINARLIRKDLFHALGGFSLDYTLASDRDFLIRAAKEGIRQQEIEIMTYRYRWHQGSSTMTEGNSLTKRLSGENLAIVRSHLRDPGGLKPREREALRAWHTRLTVQAAMNALESPPGFFTSLFEGHRENPLWSMAFLSEILGSLPGFLTRGCRTRSQQMHRS